MLNNNSNNGHNNKRKVKIPKSVKLFTDVSFKDYKKGYKKSGLSKKEVMEDYMYFLIELLPDVTEWVIREGYKPHLKDYKDKVYRVINNEDLMNLLAKLLKKKKVKASHYRFLAIILIDMIKTIKEENDKILAQNPKATPYPVDDMVKVSILILKKKMKNCEKNNIDREIAFDVLSIIPSGRVIEMNRFYRMSSFYKCLYEHAKTKEFTSEMFANIMNTMIDEKYHDMFILFALLEKNTRFSQLNETQKKLYLAISEWCFSVLNAKDVGSMRDILQAYVNQRKSDDRNDKDAPRRYPFLMIIEDDYPKIYKVVHEFVTDYPDAEKYLN